MIIKAKAGNKLNVIVLFYSTLLGRSVYLDKYFFRLKFLNLFSINSSNFYHLSLKLYFCVQNYWYQYNNSTMHQRYIKINGVKKFEQNFLALLFNKTLVRKRAISKLI